MIFVVLLLGFGRQIKDGAWLRPFATLGGFVGSPHQIPPMQEQMAGHETVRIRQYHLLTRGPGEAGAELLSNMSELLVYREILKWYLQAAQRLLRNRKRDKNHVKWLACSKMQSDFTLPAIYAASAALPTSGFCAVQNRYSKYV
jgi:hypothetical protein